MAAPPRRAAGSLVASPEVRDERPQVGAIRQLQCLLDGQPQVQRQAALQGLVARAPHADASSAQRSPAPIQRQITLRAPTRWYRRAGGSAASNLNQAIERYNAAFEEGASIAEKQNRLAVVRERLAAVSTKKDEFADRLRQEIDREASELAREATAVHDVMALARRRAQEQAEHPLLDPNALAQGPVAPQELEVLHGMNPLTMLAGGGSVGDSIARSREIRNVHQTGKSTVGGHADSPKRKTAEIGLFYPERYRRDSFSRLAHNNASATKGLAPEHLPPDRALPKYAALNIARSDFGALADIGDQETLPLHLAFKPEVLRERGTMTTQDSLREWTPGNPEHEQLVRLGAISEHQPMPQDARPWGTGPIATFDGTNVPQVLRLATGGQPREKNPDSYIEVQIHGEVRIDRDVSHVRGNFARLFGNPRFESLYRTLCDSGITILWYFRHSHPDVAEGNLVTQTAESRGQFEAAWKHAAGIWKQADKWIDKRSATDPRLGPTGAQSMKDSGTLSHQGQLAMKALWDDLK